MLLGFYKTNEETECKCRIIAYTDRVWTERDQTATVHRSFTLEVLSDSPKPLSKVSMLVPPTGSPAGSSLRSTNETAFEENWVFNSPAFRSTREYSVPAPNKPGADNFGIISDDGIDGIKVFVGPVAAPSRYRLKDCEVIEFRFPQLVQAGQKVQSRISFSIANFGQKLGGSSVANFYYQFFYFNFAAFPTECGTLIQKNFIKVHLQPSAGPGGFSILLYSPPGFQKTDGFEGSKESWDPKSPDGAAGEPRTKCLWQLRSLLELQEAKDLGPEVEAVVIRGSFGKRLADEMIKRLDQIPPQIEDLEKKIKDQAGAISQQADQIKNQAREVRWATVVAVAAVIIAVITLIPFFRDCARRRASPPSSSINSPVKKTPPSTP